MSFGSGGFGSTNTGGGFGGFGSTNTGFGANNNNNNTAQPSLFGSTNSTGGFGATNNTTSGFGGGFGAKPTTTGGFGGTAATTSAPSLFGGNTSTTGGFGGGGGFGTNNTASTGFGSNNTNTGGLFGQNKPATTGFGGATTGGSLFGGGGTTGGFGANNTTQNNAFGSTSNTGGFGANNTTNTGGFGGGFGASTTATNNQGSAAVPFQAFTEKDAASNQTSHYQSITMMQPYQGKSFEELRVEDYAQGRRFGNQNGQAGTFGQSTGFGGSTFGANNNTTAPTTGGLFGGNNNNTTTTTGNTGFGGFGATNNNTSTTGGFGQTSTNTGGLFGSAQNKPTTGLFGNTTNTTTTGGFGSNTGNTGGGLFGGSGGFGANNNNQQQQIGGLFGASNQQQNKPALGGFGSTPTNTGFGTTNNNTNTGGLFGSSTNTSGNTGGGLFGSTNNQPQQQTGGLFGASQNAGGSSLFGNTQNKPAGTGLFGASNTTANTGGGLFGSNNNQQQQNTGFGANTGGLFGNNNNNQNKPGLFGASTTNQNTGGGLFGSTSNQQPQQQQTGGLFGSNNNAGNSLFGNTQNKPAGSSLFGSTSNNNNNSGGSSLFGTNNQQNQQSTGNSLFGNMGQNNQSQQQNNSLFSNSFGQSQTPQQNQLHASLTMSPYGNDQLFSSLGQSSTPVGPLATPLNGARAMQNKTPSLLSSTRLNSPVYTPRASTMGRNGGYGLSYSTYGTPGSAYSVSLTPQQSSLLKPSGSLGSALTSRLAKSMSMNNLRGGDGTPRDGESLLRPTPGSASQRYLQSGNMRKLVIDRSLRTDLFAPPEQRKVESARRESDIPSLRKKVSFDNTAGQSDATPTANNAVVRTEDSDDNDSPPSLFRAAPKQQNGAPEMQQANNGVSLTTVPEDTEPQRPTSAPATQKPAEKDPGKNVDMGEYWCKPSLKDLKNMSRAQLSKIGKFVVGRDNVGRIEFSPCDLTNTDLDDIFGKICNFRPRQVTVYPENASKPPMGKGLNVPSTIYLENSWPRSHGGRKAVEAKTGPAYEKHIKRLRGTRGTEFVNYDADTGVWTFKVQHFTTYGFDEDSDEFTEDTEMEQEDIHQETSGLSEPPEDETMQSVGTGTGELDDTFDFQKNKKRSQSSWLGQSAGQFVPGGFGESQLGQSLGFDESQHISHDYNGHEDDGDQDHTMSGGLGDEEDPFVSAGGAVQAPSPGAYERHHSSMALDDDAGAVDSAEDMQDEPSLELPGSFGTEEPKYLRSILKPAVARSTFASPEKLATDAWEEQLQRTMSPRKRDRQALRELQLSMSKAGDQGLNRSLFGQSTLGQSALGQSYLAQKSAKKVGFGASTFANESKELGRSQTLNSHMDLMNSLWEQQKPTKKAPAVSNGFENPYPKRLRPSAPQVLSDKENLGSHDSMKPFFSNDGLIVYSAAPSAPEPSEPLNTARQPLIGEQREVRFAKWSEPKDINPTWFGVQKESTVVKRSSKFPQATTDAHTPFLRMADEGPAANERAIWTLAHILFDSIDTFPKELKAGMTAEQITQYEGRLKKDALGAFWSEHLANTVEQQLGFAHSPEERALLHLTMNNIDRACEVLVAAKDFKLATMVAQLPSTRHSNALMKEQIQAWLKRRDWSEMSEPVRALYSILAGQVCSVVGTGPKEHAEDRVSSFCISEQFSLTWMQSFALRLYFGGHASIAEAVDDYAKDLQSGAEKVPASPSWQHADADTGREDTLLGLLRLSVSEVDLELLFDARTVSGSAFNSRVAWQLVMCFDAKGISKTFPSEKLDQLSLDFATELEVAGQFITAVWVLLHIRDRSAREKATIAIITRNAAKIPAPIQGEDGGGNAFAQLTKDFLLPSTIIWQAKAQHARAELRDANLQTVYLLNAGAFEKAHAVLSDTLGPTAVIEEDYESLRQILTLFQNSKPYEWERSGQVFEDFVAIVHMPTKTKLSKDGRDIMERLSAGLETMRESGSGMTLEQRVAIVEMTTVLGEEVREFERSGVGRVKIKVNEMEVDSENGPDMGALEKYQVAMGIVA
ncbi:hypothetical protein DOTSEDRAFT_71457 [Dothistroma septosporum NZE10]|uniref:Peptidase S59 domain-containing protein n=1 Tax=Dothistroma septosporum (strain NZE10 / CBS 128990) TaxID=675120 RepID=N1PTN6_DOTSN|nr:hypothetical protein DOTSEDRAFT_71457 [Dothistroma septosporum NZE10]